MTSKKCCKTCENWEAFWCGVKGVCIINGGRVVRCDYQGTNCKNHKEKK